MYASKGNDHLSTTDFTNRNNEAHGQHTHNYTDNRTTSEQRDDDNNYGDGCDAITWMWMITGFFYKKIIILPEPQFS